MPKEYGMQSWLHFWASQTEDSEKDDARKIVEALQREPDDATIHMKCFSHDEANKIHAALPDAYKGRVRFTWRHPKKP